MGHFAGAIRRLVAVDQSLPPAVRELLSVGVHGQILHAGVVGVEPVGKTLRRQVGELQQQIREVALGVDHHCRHAVDGGLFEQRDRQAGLARAGHADDDAVRGQVAGVVHDELVGQHLLRAQIVLAAEVKTRRPIDAVGLGRRGSGGGRDGRCGNSGGVVGHGAQSPRVTASSLRGRIPDCLAHRCYEPAETICRTHPI